MDNNKWSTVKIGDLGRVVTGKTPPTADPEHYGGELPFITPSDMMGQKHIDRTERTISAKGRLHVKSLVIPPRTVFVSCIGSDMGKVGMTRVESVTNQQINSIIVQDGVNPNYVYYNLYSRKEELQRLATSGSAQPILNKGHFSQLKITLPPLPEQKAIASILGTLDDKIELKRKMNETLEAMAKAIFKSWFVDFDPILGLGPHKEWQDSPLGRIPKWEKGTINWATPKDLASLSSPVLLDTERRITEKGLEQISSGLLPKGTVLLSSRAPIGYLAIAEIPVAINQGFIAMICEQELPNYYILQWTKANMDIVEGRANGTTFLEVSKTNFRPIPIVIPYRNIFHLFQLHAEAIHKQIATNLNQALSLATIRNSLLPELLSGEIRVKDAEGFVEIGL